VHIYSIALTDGISSLCSPSVHINSNSNACITYITSFINGPRPRLRLQRLHFGLRFTRLLPFSVILSLLHHRDTLLSHHPAPIRRRSDEREHGHEHSEYSRSMGFDRMHSEVMESEMSESGSEPGSPERTQAGPSKRKSQSDKVWKWQEADEIETRQPRQPLRRGDACLMCRAKKLVSTPNPLSGYDCLLSEMLGY